jgi:hypothetical protein
MGVSDQLQPQAALVPRKSPLISTGLKLCGPRSRYGHYGEEKHLAMPGIEIGSSSPYSVAVPTELTDSKYSSNTFILNY